MRTQLMIIEVSQKQAYIFKSKRLKDNILASNIIRYVTSSEFFEKEFKGIFNKDKNLVYAGGGHTILRFESNDDENKAREFSKKLGLLILEKYEELELFIKIENYNGKITPAENVEYLIKQLEKKKALRKSAFHQGRFGFESFNKAKNNEDNKKLSNDIEKSRLEQQESRVIRKYQLVNTLDDLGGKKNDKNFIAVVHIDGNLMGAKVANVDKQIDEAIKDKKDISEKLDKYCEQKKAFSDYIDKLFGKAYLNMIKEVRIQLYNNMLNELDIKNNTFPVRRVITAGDDICFVCEGRIGIECAVKYMKELNKISKANKENYKKYGEFSACAGVAIVHNKYPFYKAYELAEALCSNAKKYIADFNEDGKANICAIDWHIEYGQMKGSLSHIRQDYIDKIGKNIVNRPYYVCGCVSEANKIRKYEDFKRTYKDLVNKLSENINEDYNNNRQKSKTFDKDNMSIEKRYTVGLRDDVIARSKLKGLRDVLKQNQNAVENYLKRSLGESIIKSESDVYVYNNLFDVIETADVYIDFGVEKRGEEQ